jgi:hypothetical protein
MKERPILYESACIFSIVGSSIGFLMMVVATFFFEFVTEKIRSVTDLTATAKLSPLYFAMLMAAFSVSLAGAIQLYQMKHSGLYFYLSAQLVILFLPVMWMGSNAFSVTNAISTLMFSCVYLFYYRRIKLLKD